MNQTGKNIKTIGLIVEDCFRDFSKAIIHSVAHGILGRKGLRLVVISGKQIELSCTDERTLAYIASYNSIYYINDMFSFDGVIMTFPNLNGMRRELFAGIPRVFIASGIENETLVNYDNEKGIREAVDYLVKIKGVTRICMLGGRDDNADAVRRKEIFGRCLKDNGLSFTERQYVEGNMLDTTHDSARKLLAMNPDAQAIFCVNDGSAIGLYDVLHEKGLMPGRNIEVFGFDNSNAAGDMVPPLSSIGAEDITLGEAALNLLLDKMEGKEVASKNIATRLYGRESFEYEMFEFTTNEMLDLDSPFIDNFFDDCFYRYNNEVMDSRKINLKRLFHEILYRTIKALNDRYMSEESFSETKGLINIFFENGGMRYTDANRFIRNIEKFQQNMNETRRTGYARTENNRLFSYMKDKAIEALAFRRSFENRQSAQGRSRIFDFMIYMTGYGIPGEKAIDLLVENFDRAGVRNGALFLYEAPVAYEEGADNDFPSYLMLRCVIREGKLYVVPKERQRCPIEDIFTRSELPDEGMGYITFPLFYGNTVYGLLLSTVDNTILDTGEFISMQLGRTIHMNWGTSNP